MKFSEALNNIFQSTQPSQAVTVEIVRHRDRIKISIHTALAGCDVFLFISCPIDNISIHTALAGCDSAFADEELSDPEFQSTQPSQAVTVLNM